MKQKRTLFTGIAIGLVTSFLISMMVVPGFAAGVRKTITAYVGDIDIYVDNKLKIPTDANGNRVEPMIYDGTTYLPVRAISTMLGEDVTWDGDTRSIYIGDKPSKGTVGVAGQDIPTHGWCSSEVLAKATFSVLGDRFTHANVLDMDPGYALTWKLDSNYTSIDGKFIMAYDSLGARYSGALEFYNVDQYGTKTLIKRVTNACGDGAVDVHVDVTGCNFVELRVEGVDWNYVSYDNADAVFYDITGTKYR